jgi:hypothetical protein
MIAFFRETARLLSASYPATLTVIAAARIEPVGAMHAPSPPLIHVQSGLHQ